MTDAPGTSNLAPPESIGELRRQRLQWARLYFVCEALPQGEDPESMLNAAMGGGAGMIELRDREHPRRVIERAGQTFRRLANTYSALFIVNDDPYLALALRADGVHVGQDDMDPAEARRIMGPDAIIGLSTHTRGQIEAVAESPVDYISVGPIWETPTKEGRPATGLELVRAAADVAARPWFAIGGIDPGNVEQVVRAGASRICVVRAIRNAEDPRAAATALIDAIDPVAREAVDDAGERSV
ncbi:MAG TPA: thiamine phosphate synthase [Solirubrobacterales bacterium]